MIGTNKFLCYLALGILPTLGFSQDKTSKTPENWYNLDFQKDGYMGISTEKAQELLKGKKSNSSNCSCIRWWCRHPT
jgi:hypothetical protein